MIRNLLYLSDNTCISSGVGQTNAIQNCTVTECVNSGKELTIGSTCCACLEAKIFAPGGELNIPTGKSVTLCKEVDGGEPVQVGVFLPERPVKANANVYKLTAYDNVSLLGKDLSTWLKGLKWPAAGYPLLTFAGMVCTACGLTLATTDIPNATMPVYQFYKAGVTGRQLMRWIGECAGRFCRANARGKIELAWYTASGVTVRATGDRYYFAGKLSYEDYNVAAIDAVKLRLADSEDGALWPSDAADNPYIITGNPILISGEIAARKPYLTVIQQELAKLPTYRPCKVSLPASMDIRAGHTVQIVDKNGVSFTTCVMTKIQKGQKDTLECTGSARRDSATAANNKTPGQVAQQAVDAQTWLELFSKLTDGGRIQGLLTRDGKYCVSAECVIAGVLEGMQILAGSIKSKNGKIKIDLGTSGGEPQFNTGISTNGLRVRADEADVGNLFVVDAYKNPNNDTYYGAISLNSTSGVRLLDILEAFSASDGVTPVGCSLKMNSQDQSKRASIGTSASAASLKLEGGGTAACVTQANSNAAGIFLLQNGSTVGGLSVNNGVATLVISKINGKTVYWDDNGDGTYSLKGK